MPAATRRTKRTSTICGCSTTASGQRSLGPTRSPSRLLVDRQRPVRDLDEDSAVLDDDRIDRQRHLRRRIERFSVAQVEPRQVQGAGQRSAGEEALVELEVFVAADPLDRAELTAGVDDEDLVGP